MKIPKDLLYVPKKFNPEDCKLSKLSEAMLKNHDENFANLVECDAIAKERGMLVGRYFSEGYADGKAFYQIIEATARTVTMRVVTGIGDDWEIPYFGKEASGVKREYVQQNINRRDWMANIFANK